MTRILLLCLFSFGGSPALLADTLHYRFYYETNLYQPSQVAIQEFAGLLPAKDSFRIESVQIRSYCDDVGTDEYNQQLSARRAAALSAQLQGYFPGVKISARGMGEIALAPRETDDIPDSAHLIRERSRNRVSEVQVIYTRKERKIEDLKVGERIVLENLLFVGGYAVLLPESFPTLDTLLNTLLRNPRLVIHIYGHVCCTPADQDGLDMKTGSYNLSVQRAKAVYTYLVNKGIDPSRLSYEGLGGSQPLGKGDKYDRRVEIEVRSN